MHRLQRSVDLLLLSCLGFAVALGGKERLTFIAVKNQTSSCYYDETFLQSESSPHSSTSTCAMNCYLQSQCVSASYNPEEGRCQLNDKIQCSTYPAMKAGWMMFRHAGDRSCNTSVGYTFYEGSRLCCKLYDEPTSTTKAIKVCKNDGGELMKITSPEQQDAVALYLAEVGNNMTDILVDGRRRKTNTSDIWTWTEESKLELIYRNWYPGEPNPLGNWRCIVLGTPWRYQWRAVRCYDNFKFLCEIQVGN